MKKIIFIRPAPYSDLIQGKSLIESFDLVGSRSENPALFSSTLGVKNKIEHVINKFDLKNFKVISSPALRTQETAKLFEVPFDVSPLLQEFKFSLTDTLSQSLTNSENIDVNKLRKSLIDAFLDGKMEEKPQEILERIERLVAFLKEQENDLVCVSHAFIMKFIEIFFRMNCIIDDPQVFGTAWNWEKKPYDFLEGFCVTTDNHTIKITQIHYNK